MECGGAKCKEKIWGICVKTTPIKKNPNACVIRQERIACRQYDLKFSGFFNEDFLDSFLVTFPTTSWQH